MPNSKRKRLLVRQHRRQPAFPSRQSGIDRMASEKLLSRDELIFRKGQKATQIYKVKSGCIRTFTHHRDGRRFVTAFYFPGDYFGLDMRERHRVTASAVTPSEILLIGRRPLMLGAANNVTVANEMLRVTNLELQRAHQHSLLLRNSANERVGQFLFDMKKRGRRKEVDVAMSRQDIADYLNLTVESVARALTQLEKVSAISKRSTRRIAVHMRKSMAA